MEKEYYVIESVLHLKNLKNVMFVRKKKDFEMKSTITFTTSFDSAMRFNSASAANEYMEKFPNIGYSVLKVTVFVEEVE